MSFLCGIDEVGYGPKLGPLVITAALFEVPDVGADLWKTTGIARSPSRKSVAVCDSKRLYHPPDLAPLERTALAFWNAREGANETTFLEMVAAQGVDTLDELSHAPWYRELAHRVPFAQEGPIPCVRKALEKGGVKFVGVRSAVLDARGFNDGVARLGNKSDLLFEASSRLYRWAWESGACRVVVGKQGGRAFYGEKLQRVFPGTFVMTGQEGAEESAYQVTSKGRQMSVAFTVDAEDKHFAVGLASIVAKYLREGLMRAFNKWWGERLPGLKPTAGYHTDANRFLKETERLREELKVEDRVLVRTR